MPEVSEIAGKILPLEPASFVLHTNDALKRGGELTPVEIARRKRLSKMIEERRKAEPFFEKPPENWLKDERYLRSLLFADSIETHAQASKAENVIVFCGKLHVAQVKRLLLNDKVFRATLWALPATTTVLLRKNRELNQQIIKRHPHIA